MISPLPGSLLCLLWAPEQAQQQHRSISVQFVSQGRGLGRVEQGQRHGFREQAPVVAAAGQGLQGGSR